MTSVTEAVFIETREYRRFQEFCDVVRKDRCIGLCYGPPGVGKTLSARHYTNWNKIEVYDKYMASTGIALNEVLGSTAVFYTIPMVNGAHSIHGAIEKSREALRKLIVEDMDRQKEIRIAELRKDALNLVQDEFRRGIRWMPDFKPSDETERAIEKIYNEYSLT